jgi:uncharacterized paraquat-inducible protein A
MFLQEAPAETTGYMIFGYIVIFGILAAYLLSLRLRWRSLEKDEELLEGMDQP